MFCYARMIGECVYDRDYDGLVSANAFSKLARFFSFLLVIHNILCKLIPVRAMFLTL
jgi:hypothetical protein